MILMPCDSNGHPVRLWIPRPLALTATARARTGGRAEFVMILRRLALTTSTLTTSTLAVPRRGTSTLAVPGRVL
nr:hypothetical protein [bacterium]